MKRRSLLPLYFTQSLRQFTLSFLSLFSAIYIYKTLNSLTFVFLFFLFLHLAKFLTNFLAEELSLKLGLKKQIYLGQIFLILAILCLLFSQKNSYLLFLAPFCWGVSSGFYWFGWHGLMAKIAALGEYGQALGKQEIFSLVPLLVGPILGGVLINFFGYSALFSAACFFIILSFLTFQPLSEEKTHYDTTPSEVFNLLKTHQRMFLAYFGDSGSAVVYIIVFPLYLFLILKRELVIGEFFSLSLILVAILNFLIGRFVDIRGKREMIFSGTLLSFFIWLGRVIARGVNFFFFLDVSERVVEKMTAIPLNVLTYEKALDGGSTGRAVLFREMAAELGAMFACLMLLLISNLRLSFVLGAILTLFPLLVIKKGGVYGDSQEKV